MFSNDLTSSSSSQQRKYHATGLPFICCMKLIICCTHFIFSYRDNPNVDIVGANLYDRFIKRKDSNGNGLELPVSRLIPDSDELHEQTVESCHSLLVGTGVYKHKPEEETETGTSPPNTVYHGHRDIAHEPELATPHKYVHDVFEGIKYIFRHEGLESH